MVGDGHSENSGSSTTAAIPPLHRPMGHCIAATTPYRRGLPDREVAQLESAVTLWPLRAGGRCLAPITSSEFAHAPLPECCPEPALEAISHCEEPIAETVEESSRHQVLTACYQLPDRDW